MKPFIYAAAIILISSPTFAQQLIDEQEIYLPDYILSPSENTDIEEIIHDNNSVAESPFEDELEMLLKLEKETLLLYKFNASIFVLNKNINKTTKYNLDHNNTISHNSLEISAKNCLHNHNSKPNNDYIFLNVEDKNTKSTIYRGWMSKRLPGLNPFNHPTYTIKVTGCSISNELIIDEEPSIQIDGEKIIIEEQQTISSTSTMDTSPTQPIEMPDNIILLPDVDNALQIITQ